MTTMAFFEYILLYVKEILEIMALIKPSQLNDNSVNEAIDTPAFRLDFSFW